MTVLNLHNSWTTPNHLLKSSILKTHVLKDEKTEKKAFHKINDIPCACKNI